jgi:large subunit ribosomal protein L14
MLRTRSIINIVDNSGIVKIRCIKIIKKHYFLFGFLGDVLIGSIYKGNYLKNLGKKRIYYVLIIGIKRWTKRFNGIYFKNDKNCGLLLSLTKDFLGTRIDHFVPHEIKKFLNYIQIHKYIKNII